MAFSHVTLVGNPAAVCKKRIATDVEGKLYMLLSTIPSVTLCDTDESIFHSPDMSLHPWRTGLLDAVNVKNPALYTAIPLSALWKMVVYLALARPGTLIKEWFFSTSNTCATLTGVFSCQNWNSAVLLAHMIVPLGNATPLPEWPMHGRLSLVAQNWGSSRVYYHCIAPGLSKEALLGCTDSFCQCVCATKILSVIQQYLLVVVLIIIVL